jgi:hypothetical protein
MPPRNSTDFLEFTENCTFLDRKLTSALNETVAGHKLVISGVGAPGRQGAKSNEYLDIPIFCTGSRTGSIGIQNDTLFLCKPFSPRSFRSEACATLKAIKGIQRFQEISDFKKLWTRPVYGAMSA